MDLCAPSTGRRSSKKKISKKTRYFPKKRVGKVSTCIQRPNVPQSPKKISTTIRLSTTIQLSTFIRPPPVISIPGHGVWVSSPPPGHFQPHESRAKRRFSDRFSPEQFQEKKIDQKVQVRNMLLGQCLRYCYGKRGLAPVFEILPRKTGGTSFFFSPGFF